MISNSRRRSFGSLSRAYACASRVRPQLESLESRRVLAAMISGTVINDVNGNGVVDVGEPGQAEVTTYLDLNGNDRLDTVGKIVEPDNFAANAPIDGAAAGVTLRVAGTDNGPLVPSPVISSSTDPFNSTGQRVFGYDGVHFFNSSFRLRMDFASPVSAVAIDFIGQREFARLAGVLQAYNAEGVLLAEDVSSGLLQYDHETISVSLEDADIAYAVAYTEHPDITGRFDALRINSEGSEPWTITDANGAYELTGLAAGTYRVNEVVPAGFRQTLPASGDGSQTVTLTADQKRTGVVFANTAAAVSGAWQNKKKPMDVSNDGLIVPLDVLLIINELNEPLYHDPANGKLVAPPTPIPAYFDVDGDSFVTPTDAILVINFLNSTVAAVPAPTPDAEGEPEVTAEAAPVQAAPVQVAAADALFALAADADATNRKRARD